MSNTVTRRRVELSEGKIVIRRIAVETGHQQPVRDAAASPQTTMSVSPLRSSSADRAKRGVTGWWRKRH